MKISLGLVAKIILLALLLGTIVFLRSLSLRLHTQLIQAQQIIAASPGEALAVTAAQAELARRALDLDRLRSYVVLRDRLADAITTIEAQGAALAVTVAVSNVRPHLAVDDEGKIVEPGGPVRPIRLTIQASGAPSGLLTLLYRIEHLPYLLHAQTWRVTASPLPGGAKEATQAAVPTAKLEADLIMYVSTENNDS